MNVIAHWERALANLPGESGFRNMVAGSLVEAREELGRAKGTPSGTVDARAVAQSPQPGDLKGASAPVAPSASGVAVRIDRVRGGQPRVTPLT